MFQLMLAMLMNRSAVLEKEYASQFSTYATVPPTARMGTMRTQNSVRRVSWSATQRCGMGMGTQHSPAHASSDRRTRVARRREG